MKLFLLSAGAAVTLILFFSCSLPTMTSSSTSASTGSGGSTSGGSTSSLSVTTSGAQGVLVTPKGRLDIAAVGSDGVKVTCAVPYGVSRLGGTGTDGSAVILGKTSTGAPGIWIYDKGKIVAPWNEDTGRHSSRLGDSDEHNGMLRGHFGWSYTQMGSAEGTYSKLIAGVAENKKGFTYGKFSIDPGTTIGVYWMIWKDRHDRRFVVSNARIIGVLASEDSHHDSWWHHHFFDLFFHRFEMLRAFFTGTFTAYLTAVDKNGVSYDTKSSNYIVSGSDGSNASADAAISEHGQVLSIAANATQSSSVDLTASAITPSAYSVAEGNPLNVSFNVENLGNTAVTSSFAVNLYWSTSSTFSPSTTNNLKTIGLSGIGATGTSQGTISENSIPVTIPSSVLPSGVSGENIYIYAEVVAPSGITDSNPSNNISTPSQAAVVFANNSSSSSPTYNVVIETYGTTGGSSNPGVALYKYDQSTGLSFLKASMTEGSNTYNSLDYTSTGLPAGTYYVSVFPLVSGGSYAINVRTANVASTTFTALTADPPNATNVGSATANTVADQFNFNPYTGVVPTGAQLINVGNALNWYLASADANDWFTFTLP